MLERGTAAIIRLRVLSGPGFAADIAKGLPTAMAIAAADMRGCRAAGAGDFRPHLPALCLGRPHRRAAGRRAEECTGDCLRHRRRPPVSAICARAALIARGLARNVALRRRQGRQSPDTVRGLSGLGDLVLTATSHQSRNLRFGIAPRPRRKGRRLSRGELVEGAFAAAVAVAACRKSSASTCRSPDAVAAIIDGTPRHIRRHRWRV